MDNVCKQVEKHVRCDKRASAGLEVKVREMVARPAPSSWSWRKDKRRQSWKQQHGVSDGWDQKDGAC